MADFDTQPSGVKAGEPVSAAASKPVTLRGHDFPEGFRFKEKAGKKEEIILAGSWMPVVPFVFGGKQRLSKEYYPGNSEPTIHVLGSEEEDVTVKGRLHAKRLPNQASPDLYRAPLEMQELIDSVRRRGSLLEITLGEWKRTGFLSDCSFEMKKLGDIDYSLTFTIVSQELNPRNYLLVNASKSTPTEVNEAVKAALVALQNKKTQIPAEVPTEIGRALNEATDSIADALKLVTDIVDSIVGAAAEIAGSVTRVLGLIRYASGLVESYKRQVGKMSFAVTQSANFQNAPEGMSVGASLVLSQQQTAAYALNYLSDLNSIQARLSEMRGRFQEMAKTVPLYRHRVISGDSLQRLSVTHYGNPDDWKAIYDHNNLKSTELVVGSILEIPRL